MKDKLKRIVSRIDAIVLPIFRTILYPYIFIHEYIHIIAISILEGIPMSELSFIRYGENHAVSHNGELHKSDIRSSIPWKQMIISISPLVILSLITIILYYMNIINLTWTLYLIGMHIVGANSDIKSTIIYGLIWISKHTRFFTIKIDDESDSIEIWK